MAIRYAGIVTRCGCIVRPWDPPGCFRTTRPLQRSPRPKSGFATPHCCFAVRGIAATTLRAVAEPAEVSIGLVQHHFRTKAALSAAVDQYVLQVVSEALEATALPEALSDGLDEAGRRLTSLMAEHPDLITYLDAGSPRAAHSDRSFSPDFWASVRPSATSSPGGARPTPTSIPIGRHSTR